MDDGVPFVMDSDVIGCERGLASMVTKLANRDE